MRRIICCLKSKFRQQINCAKSGHLYLIVMFVYNYGELEFEFWHLIQGLKMVYKLNKQNCGRHTMKKKILNSSF